MCLSNQSHWYRGLFEYYWSCETSCASLRIASRKVTHDSHLSTSRRPASIVNHCTYSRSGIKITYLINRTHLVYTLGVFDFIQADDFFHRTSTIQPSTIRSQLLTL